MNLGVRSAILENVSATWPASVVSDFKNVRRTGILKKRLRTSMTVPVGQPQLLIGPAIPASIVISDPSAASAWRV